MTLTRMTLRRRGLLILLGGILCAAAIPASAEAAFDKSIVDPSTEAELGSISFPAATGSSAVGVAFAMDGYSEENITSISWEIDGNGAVVALDLRALKGDDPCPNGSPDGCSQRTLTLHPESVTRGMSRCSATTPGTSGACLLSLGVGFIAFADPTPAYRCEGFKGPLVKGPVAIKNKRLSWLRATLRDEGGTRLRRNDLVAAPILEVTFDAATEAAAAVHAGHWPGIGSDGTAFVAVGSQWHLLLTLKDFADPGSYTVRLVSGDPSEYRLDPTCEGVFTR